MINSFVKRTYFKILFSLIVLTIGVSLFGTTTINAQLCQLTVTDIYFKNSNPTNWQVRALYYNYSQNTSPDNPQATFTAYVPTSLGTHWKRYRRPMSGDKIKWYTACVDPVVDVNVDVTSDFCLYQEEQTYQTQIDIGCHNVGYSGTSTRVYGGCGTNWDTANWGNVGVNSKCPSNSNYCVWGGQFYGACNDYCGGNTPANNCERINRNCTSSGCDVTSRRTYAAICNDPDGGQDGGNRCAPNPPGGRTETAFCQGPAGTDRAAGIKFNWDRIALSLERDSNPYDIQFRQVGGGDLHEINGIDAVTYEYPGNGCTSGPGGCSLPYDRAYEWRIRAHTEPGIAGPTDWSSWRTQRTNDCSGKPDLRITAFTFPGGNSGGTSDAVVTINNNGDKGTGGVFNVKVNNGNGAVKTVETPALAEGGTRDVTVPNIARPNAGSHTATATVDSGTVINEANETNNNRDDVYNTTSNINGIIFEDTDGDGIKDAAEDLYTTSIAIRVNGVNYTTTNGNYQSAELTNGTYNISMPNIPSTHKITTPVTNPGNFPIQRTLGPNRTVNFGLDPQTANITVDVFTDYNNDGVWNIADGDEAYQGATVTATGIASAGSPYTTNASGRASMLNLEPGSSTITLTIPAGYNLSTPKPPAPNNAITVDIPPGENIDFGLWPTSGPSCAGGLTATPSTVNAGAGITSQLRCVNPNSPTGDPLEYTWFSDGTGTVDNVNSAVSTWRSPTTTSDTITNPSVTVCYQGTNRCSSSTTTINLSTISTITGNVYIDVDEDGTKDLDELNYSGNITMSADPVNGSSSTDTAGAYTISDLPPGDYTISYTDLPSSYRPSYPQSVPPQFTVSVGNQVNCNTSITGYTSATCTNGSISNLNFGIITNDGPWVQTGGSDMWFNSGYPYTIPAAASCQPYASTIGSSGTPGVVYTGVGTDSFGSGQASQNPYNWKVGGISTYSESYGPASSGSPLATSYSYVRNLAITNGTPPTNLTNAHCGAGGTASCNLSATLASGIYEASGNLTLASNYAFPANRNYVILVTGNLYLNGTIDVPIGSTVLFSVQGNIYVDPAVGTSTITSLTPHLEGWFSTDHSFYIEGENTCPTADNRLNMEGALIVNASLLGGSLYNLRDLCSGNSNCPVFYVKERPDFSLNAPRFIKNAPRVYKEVAP